MVFSTVRDWKTTVHCVVWILSVFFGLFIFLMPIEARDYHIRAGDGEVYTITLGETPDVDNFSVRKSNGEILRGVTEAERAATAELYFAAKLFWHILPLYSLDAPVEDLDAWVTDIARVAIIRLLVQQGADILLDGAVNGFLGTVQLLLGGNPVEIVEGWIPGALNDALEKDAEQRLLIDAGNLAKSFAATAVKHENMLRDFYVSYETRSVIISIDEINTAWESFYRVVEYKSLTTNLIHKYLQDPKSEISLEPGSLASIAVSLLPVGKTTTTIAERVVTTTDFIGNVTDAMETIDSVNYTQEHIENLRRVRETADADIRQQVLSDINEKKRELRMFLDQVGYFQPAIAEQLQNQRPEAVGSISPQVMTVGDVPETLDVAPYFSSPNNLKYEVASSPEGIVTESVSGSRVTITPMAEGITTVLVTAHDANDPDLTTIQTISVVVKSPRVVIRDPDDSVFTLIEDSNPRSEGLREGVSVIIQNVPLTGPGLNLRLNPWIGNNEIRKLWDGATGIITDGPEENNGYTWWEIKWDQVDIEEVWSVETFGGDQLLFRRPPDLEIRDFDVSDSQVNIGEEIELEVEIRNNGPGESAATDLYFYYHSGSRNDNLEELNEERDLRIPETGKLRVPSLQEHRSTTLTLTVDAPNIPDRYYYGVFLPSNVHDTDYKDDLTESMFRNNLASEERVEVTGAPDYIVESIEPISVRSTTLDPGEAFTLRATVLNQGLGEPTSSATLDYYRSSDVHISTSDRWVGDDSVSELDTDETGKESINLTAPNNPGIYYYGACVSEVTNESNRNNNCSAAVAITVRNLQTVDVNADGVVNIQDLVLVASNFGETGANAADVNGDSVVNIIDLTLVAAAFGNMADAAPALWSIHPDNMPPRATVETWLQQARQRNRTDPEFQRGMLVLENLLKALTPKKTALLPNYPNPFNPETWIPYQLTKDSEVSITIYNVRGRVVRHLELRYQHAGVYHSKGRAAYWDGKNDLGEPVASGVYFYTLTAGDFSATRKMLIRK